MSAAASLAAAAPASNDTMSLSRTVKLTSQIAAVAMDLPRKPIGLGVGSGLLLSLIAETMLAMAILARVNRRTELA